jgi:hypothetical protein
MSAHEPAERLPSDPERLERLIDERRRRLAGTVDELVERAHPKEIARRGAADASAKARAAVSSADGQVDPRRLAAVVAAVVVAVAVLVISRRRTR